MTQCKLRPIGIQTYLPYNKSTNQELRSHYKNLHITPESSQYKKKKKTILNNYFSGAQFMDVYEETCFMKRFIKFLKGTKIVNKNIHNLPTSSIYYAIR